MDYNPISNFLDKFKKILFEKETVYKVISEIITKHLAYTINSSKITLKGSVIYLQGSPMLKSEVLLHKKDILSDIENTLGTKRFTDIR